MMLRPIMMQNGQVKDMQSQMIAGVPNPKEIIQTNQPNSQLPQHSLMFRAPNGLLGRVGAVNPGTIGGYSLAQGIQGHAVPNFMTGVSGTTVSAMPGAVKGSQTTSIGTGIQQPYTIQGIPMQGSIPLQNIPGGMQILPS